VLPKLPPLPVNKMMGQKNLNMHRPLLWGGVSPCNEERKNEVMGSEVSARTPKKGEIKIYAPRLHRNDGRGSIVPSDQQSSEGETGTQVRRKRVQNTAATEKDLEKHRA